MLFYFDALRYIIFILLFSIILREFDINHHILLQVIKVLISDIIFLHKHNAFKIHKMGLTEFIV